MVYTVTFNPALDYVLKVNNLKKGEVNRADEEYISAGGKGINVSVMLTHLGIENVMLGFTAGFTGDEIIRVLNDEGYNNDFITVAGLSRINVKIKSDEETEINATGPDITEDNLNRLFDKLDKLKEEDILVLAGSVPKSLHSDIYMNIMERMASKNIKCIVDAANDLLLNVLKYHPFLIKPNKYELEELFNVTLNDNKEVMKYAKKLTELGAKNVLVSLGREGAVFVSENGTVYEKSAPEGKAVNSVGAGDSMVAGFITGYIEKHDYLHAFKMGISAGSASAFSKYLATKEEVEKLYKTL